ncbi:PhzF family isomerase [Vallitalea okinawensis]|uniref:PhzF family isomerase n=1 Tax=Vallitalea okinawensis TaxID=2078660 RepID=UPI000CFD7161|nr:PhzF family isomerase [Vallitalea okinawensis]
MSKKYRLYQIDSFTKEKFTGNPAGVVTNADGLSESEMQKIARELNNSETAFIFSSDSTDHDVYIRYFTPVNEVPICGHATIAAHYARAVENNLNTTRIKQKSGVGILPVDIIKTKDDYKIVMTQGKIEFGNYIEGVNKEALLLAIGISEEDLLENCPIQIASTGHSKVMIGIRSSTKLNHLGPDYNALSKLSEIIGSNGYYVFTLDSPSKNIFVKGRMFAPAIGINEDPVTGNANGPLGAYLVHHKLVKHKGAFFKFKAKQGEAIGRSGIIEVEVSIENKEPVEVKISGEAVNVFQSELMI